MDSRRICRLALEDGSVFTGYAFGASGEATGEVVFNTSLSGYQEILTDPSYRGQIVTMTYPMIGNYGTNPEDVESQRPFVAGFVVKRLSPLDSNWRSRERLEQYLERHGLLGLESIDTRALVRKLRIQGVMRGILSTEDRTDRELVEAARQSPGLVGIDLVKEVTTQRAYEWTEGRVHLGETWKAVEPKRLVIAYDFGIKQNILRHLVEQGNRVKVVPADTPASEVLSEKPDGVFLSNGPGDPAAVTYAIEQTRELLGKVPLFGICLGHQILGLALGGETFKLKFGHRGGNQPAQNLLTGRVEITAQNHGFCVDIESLAAPDVVLTHKNLNDGTLEGLQSEERRFFAVQYHPEASPGPHDAEYLFGKFSRLMDSG
ncbi:MAG TPA: carbamoyl-phosphate synthase small subunit [Firmicutes bacterium]|nr:carbamoyl-phosphate synthase small subunit [Bacillota bacterium]